MKIAVIGSGSMGIMFGTALSKEHDVTFLDVDNDVITSINEKGTGYFSDNELITSRDVKAFRSGTYKEKQDLVLLLVKTHATEKAMDSNLSLFGENTVLMSLQNGLSVKESLLHYVDQDHLLLGVTRTNASKFDERQSLRANHGVTYLGYTEKTLSIAKEIQSSMSHMDFLFELTDNIDKEIWSKFFLNCSTNPLCAIYNCNIDNLLRIEEHRNKIIYILKEAVAVANASGQSFDFEEEKNLVLTTCSGVFGYPSMWQDINHQRRTEIDTLNNALVNLGHQLGIDVSINEKVVNKIKEMEFSYLKKA